MYFTETDDPIRGIGFVAIFFAYLEDTLDGRIKQSSGLFVLPNKVDRLKFRDKAEWLQKQFRKAFATCTYPGSDEEGARVEHILAACREAALERNAIVHRPVIGGMNNGVMRKSMSGKMCPLDVAQIYRFAEHIYELDGAVLRMSFTLGRLLKAHGDGAVGGRIR